MPSDSPSTQAPPAARLLVVEDDPHLSSALQRFLERSGFVVETSHDGADAMARFAAATPDLVVLDLMLPGVDGWEVCRRLREHSSVPIIMLTARASEADRVLGLRMGADDYVVKPFSLRELQARVEAVLRRSGVVSTALPDVVFDDGRLYLDRSGWQVLLDGTPVRLTAIERKMLFAIAEAAGRPVAVDQLLRHVWGAGYGDQGDYVKLYVWRLRQKIETEPRRPRYIVTVRGIGYRFQSAAEKRAFGAGETSSG